MQLRAPPPAAAPARRGAAPTARSPLDRVIAVVNDEAITQYEVDEQRAVGADADAASAKVPPPPTDVLDKQVLERLITERALLQYAKETGIRVDDTQVERTIAAHRAGQQALARRVPQGCSSARASRTRSTARTSATRSRCSACASARSTAGSASPTPRSTTSSRRCGAQNGGEIEYRLSHILVVVPEQASPEQIDGSAAARGGSAAADQGGQRLRAGRGDVLRRARTRCTGGNLGWRTRGAPADGVRRGRARAEARATSRGVLRSRRRLPHRQAASTTRDRNAPTVVEQTHARHILIRVNEIDVRSRGEGQDRAHQGPLDTGAKFEDQAKLNSEDASAAKGGDLGWVSPGDTVPEFEKAMNKLEVDEVSRAGAHAVRLAPDPGASSGARRTSPRAQARAGAPAIRQRKSDEAFQDWVRQMRDRAYVEIQGRRAWKL